MKLRINLIGKSKNKGVTVVVSMLFRLGYYVNKVESYIKSQLLIHLNLMGLQNEKNRTLKEMMNATLISSVLS